MLGRINMMLEILRNHRSTTKKKIDWFLLHDEILGQEMESVGIRYIKKIMIYQMNTQYIAQYHVHIIELIIYLIDISWSHLGQTKTEISIKLMRSMNLVNFQFDSILKYYLLVVYSLVVDMNEIKLELPLENIIHHSQTM